MKAKQPLRYYLLTLGILLALSAYPLMMGLKIVLLYWRNGSIAPEEYARYVIPYTAISLSILITAALYPLLMRLKQWSALAATVLALGLFVGVELYMEGIVINSPLIQKAVTVQLMSCVYTPRAVMSFQGVYDDTYKIHYFLVSFVMVALVVNVVYGYGRLFSGQAVRKPALAMQTAAAALFVGLCVFANLTGFFRLPAPVQPAISGWLTGLFFVVLGAAAGIWLGSLLLGRKGLLPVLLPALLSVAVCAVMYVGEYQMLGDLYRFGQGFLYRGLPGIALAPFDILVIIASGAASAALVGAARNASARSAAGAAG